MRISRYSVSVAVIVLLGEIFCCNPSIAQELPPGDGQDIVKSACTACHGINVIASKRLTPDEWRDVVSQMVGNGASLTDDQYSAVVNYLSTKLAPNGATPAPTTSEAESAHSQ